MSMLLLLACQINWPQKEEKQRKAKRASWIIHQLTMDQRKGKNKGESRTDGVMIPFIIVPQKLLAIIRKNHESTEMHHDNFTRTKELKGMIMTVVENREYLIKLAWDLDQKMEV
jgi:hypothetical protein